MITFLLLIYCSLFWKTDTPPVENMCGIMYPWYWEQDWGNGAIKINLSSDLNLYADTIGTQIGTLSRGTDNWVQILDLNRHSFIAFVTDMPSSGTICLIDSCLFVMARNNPGSNYYGCYWNVKPGGFYIKKSEIKLFDYKFQYYADLIFEYLKGLKYDQYPKIGVNIPNSCLNIRKGPGMKYEIVGCVSSNQSEGEESRIEILDRSGDWAKVHVVKMKYVGDYPKEGEEIEDWAPCANTIDSELTGWMKMIKENGFPKIWFYTGGY